MSTVETSTRPEGDAGDLTQVIRSAILDGSFAPNQRLIEADLSESFDASRAAVRSALMNLSAEGIVERLPNRGARVRAISVGEAIEIVEARIGLETLVARKAAARITDEQADDLRGLSEEIAAAVGAGDLVGYARLNQDLDRRVRDIAGHATAAHLLERLSAQSARHQFRLAYEPGRAARSAPEHIAIIDAVVAGDADAAEQATRVHLDGIIEMLRQRS
ncbi:GntR family transcriptional regulator [Microbacterium sp. JB110]|uniref:GntR family transcriptional regulator n=1 Tax=Microbacterium sp. JB110 TaxID=2024477 RepID=UPI00097E9C76|nr:GntR family transcriptional regulator [Microbacterium sp. JB110]RCS61338.1 GntR family transcriptional regulator [Microbacterium sp. JB110]SJM50670.1 Transcriptional regulator, GntR family [Frigoribacterium sp. JB110]